MRKEIKSIDQIFIFTQENSIKPEIELPKHYQNDKISIPGVYLSSSIRFYKKRMDTISKEMFKNSTLTQEKIRRYLSIIYASMADFEIKNKRIQLKGTHVVQDKEYNFKNGIVVAKCDNFTDVIEKDSLGEYLDNYGFDPSYEDEILSSSKSTLQRTPSKKLTYFFNYKGR